MSITSCYYSGYDIANNFLSIIISCLLTLQHAGQVIADRLYKQNCYFSKLLDYYSCVTLLSQLLHLSKLC